MRSSLTRRTSQTGEAATELRRVLGVAAREDDDLAPDAVEDALADVVAARGRQPNLSFFAFTATPKARRSSCLATQPGYRKYEPSHLYSMRQAIEEGFIHDVLANYTTYETFWRIEKTITEDRPSRRPRLAEPSHGS